MAIGGVYVGQSVIGGLTYSGLPAVLRQGGASLTNIGFVYLVILPWAVKFLWAPLIERFRLPPTGKNRSGLIIFVGAIIAASGLALVGTIGPQALPWIITCLVVVAFTAATVDIACDGFAVETLAPKQRGWGSTAQVGGAYLGSAIGSGLFLVLYARRGWSLSVFSMAAVVLVLSWPFVLINQYIQKPQLRQHLPSLRFALQRREVRKGIILAGLFVTAQKFGISMLGPYLIDANISLLIIGIVNGTGGLAVGLFSAFCGGVAVRRYGSHKVLILALIMQSLLIMSFAVFSILPYVQQTLILICALAASSGVMAFGFVALYAHFMAIADPRQAGVDFTLFQCADSVVSMASGVVSGIIAGHFGYSIQFLCGLIPSIAALIFICKAQLDFPMVQHIEN
ncbi:MFS transporter [Paraburkholderia aspalathi]|nr:MFS transporter [Paraburkholderia aspalathi]